jgi:mRNA interferase MazF
MVPYQKDFDAWSTVKKQVHVLEIDHNFFFHEREIWWCAVGVNIGVETDGKHQTFERPVIIIRVFNREMLWTVPVTSGGKQSPFYYNFIFNNTEQSAMLSQIRNISSKRLRRKIGTISDLDFENIIKKLSGLLKNETPP